MEQPPWLVEVYHPDKNGSARKEKVVYKRNVPYKTNANALQTLDICIPNPTFDPSNPPILSPLEKAIDDPVQDILEKKDKEAPTSSSADEESKPHSVWLVFIHGGAWRDPSNTSAAFTAAQELLLQSPNYKTARQHIAGLASLNYSLSPSPTRPTNPSSPDDPSRNAHHPDHIHDVMTAIAFLQHNFPAAHRYILAGHSCGATLAFQAVMASSMPFATYLDATTATAIGAAAAGAARKFPSITPPLAIAGMAGLYDLPLLPQPSGEPHDKYVDFYRAFIVNAFGPEGDGSASDVWVAASPARAEYESSWRQGKVAVLAYSRGDTLVPVRQHELMRQCLQKEEAKGAGMKLVEMELQGDHDEMWEMGVEVAKVMAETVRLVVARKNLE